MSETVLFRTVHGSRLYGLAHADSDWDWYEVVTKTPIVNPYTSRLTYSTQGVDDTGLDSTVKDLGTWLMECQNGVPQALEAMFSQSPDVDLVSGLRAGYVATTSVYARYRRAMRNFAESGVQKRRRHAVRLSINMNTMRATGRFNPALTETERDMVFTWEDQYTNNTLADHVLTYAFG